MSETSSLSSLSSARSSLEEPEPLRDVSESEPNGVQAEEDGGGASPSSVVLEKGCITAC